MSNEQPVVPAEVTAYVMAPSPFVVAYSLGVMVPPVLEEARRLVFAGVQVTFCGATPKWKT